MTKKSVEYRYEGKKQRNTDRKEGRKEGMNEGTE